MMIHDFGELLSAANCDAVDQLDERLYGAFELDPSVLEVTAEAVVVGIRDLGISMPFPFTMDEFWHAITELEDQAQRRLEQRAHTDGLS